MTLSPYRYIITPTVHMGLTLDIGRSLSGIGQTCHGSYLSQTYPESLHCPPPQFWALPMHSLPSHLQTAGKS